MKASMVLVVVLCGIPALVGAASGQVTYTLEKAASPTADQSDAYARIEKAMDSALGYYNSLTSIRKSIRVLYEPSVPTADASSNGTLRFGSSRSYMVVGTAMHEISHTVGVGTTAEYRTLMVNGIFTGTRATAALREITGDNTAVLKGDAQHIWPYGLNFASEIKSTTDLVNHCEIVEGLYKDLFHESIVFEGRVRSKATGQCMNRSGTSLVLGACTDGNSLVRWVSMGETDFAYRMEFGDRVLDVSDQSTTAGAKVGLYAWNNGANQKMRIEGGTPVVGASLRLRMIHSSLFLETVGATVVQNTSNAGSNAQTWELVASPISPVKPTSMKKPGEASRLNDFDASGRSRHIGRAWSSFGW